MTVDVGTIGSAPCEVSLNKILIRLDDSKITRLIMHRHNDLRETLDHLKVLEETAGRSFFLKMARVVWEHHKAGFAAAKDRLPYTAYTHALCCYKAIYRRAIQKDELGTTQEEPESWTDSPISSEGE